MISPDVEKAIDAVDELNSLYYDCTKDEERLPFSFVYASYWMGIKYNDEVVWDDCDMAVNSTEITDEVGNYIGEDYETILDCITCRVKDIHKIVRKFKP
jgi:hypothetical protein